MTRKIFLFVILSFICAFSLQVQVHAEGKAEIFHINKGKVIKKVPMNDVIHKETETIIQSVTDLYRELEPIPQKGYMVKIPLDPAILVKNQWMEDLVSEVIVIFPEYENPHLMVFNNENMPYFFRFNGSVDKLLTKLELKFDGQRE